MLNNLGAERRAAVRRLEPRNRPREQRLRHSAAFLRRVREASRDAVLPGPVSLECSIKQRAALHSQAALALPQETLVLLSKVNVELSTPNEEHPVLWLPSTG
jgi:hypothetical protein